MAGVPAQKDERSDASIFGLSGGLFGDAPRQLTPLPLDLAQLVPPSSRRPPVNAALGETPSSTPPPSKPRSASQPPIAPVVTLDRMPRSERPTARSERPAARASAVPVVAERGSPARRGGIAGGLLGAAAVGAVIAVFVMRVADKPAQGEAPTGAPTATVEHPVAVQAAVTETPAPTPARVDPPPVAPTAETAKPKDTPTAHTADAVRPPPERTAAPPATQAQAPDHAVQPPPVATAPPATTTAPPATTAAPPPAGGGEFDRAAAKAALAAAAGAAAGCHQPDDPTGGAKVSITFGTSGRVSSASVIGGTLQGTKTGACIAAAFRRASVPPFSGDPVSVTREIAVQ
jgi:hypothetical protein